MKYFKNTRNLIGEFSGGAECSIEMFKDAIMIFKNYKWWAYPVAFPFGLLLALLVLAVALIVLWFYVFIVLMNVVGDFFGMILDCAEKKDKKDAEP